MTTPSETTPDTAQDNAPDQNNAPAPIELRYNPHEGVEEPFLILPGGAQGAAVVKDLATYISRALAVNRYPPDRARPRGGGIRLLPGAGGRLLGNPGHHGSACPAPAG